MSRAVRALSPPAALPAQVRSVRQEERLHPAGDAERRSAGAGLLLWGKLHDAQPLRLAGHPGAPPDWAKSPAVSSYCLLGTLTRCYGCTS